MRLLLKKSFWPDVLLVKEVGTLSNNVQLALEGVVATVAETECDQ